MSNQNVEENKNSKEQEINKVDDKINDEKDKLNEIVQPNEIKRFITQHGVYGGAIMPTARINGNVTKRPSTTQWRGLWLRKVCCRRWR